MNASSIAALRRHDDLSSYVATRLREKGYRKVILHQEYHVPQGDCEMDVLTVRGKFLHYYEIKGHDTSKGYHRALSQFHHVLELFPEYHWQFIYVAPGVCRRETERVYGR